MTALRQLSVQFTKFTGVGAVATLVHYAILVGLVQLFAFDALPASSAGFAISALLNYGLNYRFTFSSDKRHGPALGRFIVIALIGLALNGAILSFCIAAWNFHYLVAQVTATGIVLVWNFLANRRWTF